MGPYVQTGKSLLTFKRNTSIEPSKILGKTWEQLKKNTLKTEDIPSPIFSSHQCPIVPKY